MTNDDLKRFYNVNDKPEQNKDFVRYGSNGEIISEHDATKDEEVVNYRTLMQHASGGLQEVKATDVDSEQATQGQVLTANGSGGASWQNASGGQLYEHIIKINNCIFLSIKTESNIVFAPSTFRQWLTDNGYVWSRKWLMANGCFLTSNKIFFVTGVIKDGSLLRAGGNLISIDSNMNISQEPGINTILTISIFEDTVIEL